MYYDAVRASVRHIRWNDKKKVHEPVPDAETYQVTASEIDEILNRPVPTYREFLEQTPAKGMGRRIHRVSDLPVGKVGKPVGKGKTVPEQR